MDLVGLCSYRLSASLYKNEVMRPEAGSQRPGEGVSLHGDGTPTPQRRGGDSEAMGTNTY